MHLHKYVSFFFFFNDTATTEIYTLSLHDALPISGGTSGAGRRDGQSSGVSTASTPRAIHAPSWSGSARPPSLGGATPPGSPVPGLGVGHQRNAAPAPAATSAAVSTLTQSTQNAFTT